jgi:GMP synthase (glutamine-hydrolysing)
MGYYAEIASPTINENALADARGIVLSGGPSSVYDTNIPAFNNAILNLDIPILGLCYGHQLLAQCSGGTVTRAKVGEFGIAQLYTTCDNVGPLLAGINLPAQVWMSHQDEVSALPAGFQESAYTQDCRYAAIQHSDKKRFGLQFHVEVKDTPIGNTILENFAHVCGMEKNWNQDVVLDLILTNIKKEAAGKKVLVFLSGGVDSTVAFALLNKALGTDRVLGLHIDNGFMRQNESAVIAERYRAAGYTNFIYEDASERFLAAIAGLCDPQEKRRVVGETFLTVRDEVVKRRNLSAQSAMDGDDWLLAQGTLYPDIIESGGTQNSHMIKTHHNRVGGIQALIAKGLIIEPLKDLYKDEVRTIGTKIGVRNALVQRHPFPGPGLSINVLCSDGVLHDADEYAATQQHLAAFPLATLFPPEYHADLTADVLPLKSVGVQGDFRTYRFPVALAFGTQDALSDWDMLERASVAITNGIATVNRVVVTLFRRETLTLQRGYCDKNRLDQTRDVDAIVIDALKNFGWYARVFQHLTLNLPYASSPEHCAIVLRPVVSEDVMTARFAQLDRAVLQGICARIHALPFVDALYYDCTNKPPATFGWE